MRWYLRPWGRYAEIDGRSPRIEYWTFVLVNLALALGLARLDRAWKLEPPELPWGVLQLGFLLVSAMPTLAVSVRRLHDSGRSGLWMFLIAIPLLGQLVLIVLFCLPSTPGPNAYGPNPRDEPG